MNCPYCNMPMAWQEENDAGLEVSVWSCEVLECKAIAVMVPDGVIPMCEGYLIGIVRDLGNKINIKQVYTKRREGAREAMVGIQGVLWNFLAKRGYKQTEDGRVGIINAKGDGK